MKTRTSFFTLFALSTLAVIASPHSASAGDTFGIRCRHEPKDQIDSFQRASLELTPIEKENPWGVKALYRLVYTLQEGGMGMSSLKFTKSWDDLLCRIARPGTFDCVQAGGGEESTLEIRVAAGSINVLRRALQLKKVDAGTSPRGDYEIVTEGPSILFDRPVGTCVKTRE